MPQKCGGKLLRLRLDLQSGSDSETVLGRYTIRSGFFWLRASNSDPFYGLAQAHFEANSADFSQQTQDFGNIKQKHSEFG